MTQKVFRAFWQPVIDFLTAQVTQKAQGRVIKEKVDFLTAQVTQKNISQG